MMTGVHYAHVYNSLSMKVKAQVADDREFDKFYNRSDGDSGLLLVLKKL